MPAKQVNGRSSLNANQTTSFFFVSGFGSGAYSAKLLKGTRHRFSGFSHMRQCGEDVMRMLVTSGPLAAIFGDADPVLIPAFRRGDRPSATSQCLDLSCRKPNFVSRIHDQMERAEQPAARAFAQLLCCPTLHDKPLPRRASTQLG